MESWQCLQALLYISSGRLTTVETRYNECSWDHENSYVITIFSLYALDIALFQRVGTKNRVRYIYNFRYMHVRHSEFRLY